MSGGRRILLCGHRSFAAKGLIELLQRAGHHVVTFSRGPIKCDGDSVTGPIDQLHENPHLSEDFDTVLNYILLKDDTIEKNDAYLKSLLAFCASHKVKHLVHVSSMSTYKGEVTRVHENAELETIPQRKGSYGSLKVAQDLYLNQNTPADLRLTMLRPGFILAPGLVDPIIGMGFRFFRNKLLLMGAKGNHLPVVTRDQVNQAMARVVDLPGESNRDVFLVADPDSPTRQQWLTACCEKMGAGTKVVSYPTFLWKMAGWFGEPVARLAKMSISPNKIMTNVCRAQEFDTRESARKLGMSMKVDWPAELSNCFPGQKPNFELPYSTIRFSPPPVKNIAIVGFGRIVKQKHLPALSRLGFTGEISAYDVAERTDEDGRHIQQLTPDTKLNQAGLVVLASPGAAHAAAIPLLRTTDAPILVEKPLCLNSAELQQWNDFAGSREAGVYVCQNYRFKSNVAAMMKHLSRYNPGQLLRADVVFHSPSVGKESRPWARDERSAQTLLLDYAIHFIDVACVFNTTKWSIAHSRFEMDNLNATGLIEGRLESPTYPVNFVLRQGFMPRRTRVFFTFQNYSVSLGFFPDTFVPHMADDGPALYGAEKKASFRGSMNKIIDKLTGRDSDRSHDATYVAAVADKDMGKSIAVKSVTPFYQAIFELAQAVYKAA